MRRPERSAWLCVVDRLDWPEIDLRVDMHDRTVAELRRIFEAWKRCRAYYEARSRNPGDVASEEEAMKALETA
jgi:uncharacterized Ntn-hydrolase superfamily protein